MPDTPAGSPILLDGKAAAADIETRLKAAVDQLRAAGQRAPGLRIFLVGSHGPSLTYVSAKRKACERVGIAAEVVELRESVSQTDLLAQIEVQNHNPAVDGMIVQLPLPAHIDPNRVIEAIDPGKDVDGFHPINLGRLAQNRPAFASATPAGVMALLDHYGIETEGKHAVVVGRSNIVGTPLALLLSRSARPGNCTVTLCHSRTQNVETHTQQADILVAAAGHPGLIGPAHVREGAVVIDVGIHRVEDATKKRGYRLVGDVTPEANARAAAYSPVPGGVGPMTIALLLRNTLQAYTNHVGREFRTLYGG